MLRNLRRGSQKKALTQLPRILREQIQLYSINTNSNSFHSSPINPVCNPKYNAADLSSFDSIISCVWFDVVWAEKFIKFAMYLKINLKKTVSENLGRCAQISEFELTVFPVDQYH